MFPHSSFGGGFAADLLPSLGSDSGWTNLLAADGILSVICVVSTKPTNQIVLAVNRSQPTEFLRLVIHDEV